jgi:hypothetical protein
VSGHLLGVLEPSVVLQVNRDAGCTPGMTSYLMTVCAKLGCSIQAEITASFSLQQNVFNDLPVLRNFFAHRNEGTCKAARFLAPRYTLPSTLSPAELLLAASPGAATSIILAWLDEMNITAQFMCEA